MSNTTLLLHIIELIKQDAIADAIADLELVSGREPRRLAKQAIICLNRCRNHLAILYLDRALGR